MVFEIHRDDDVTIHNKKSVSFQNDNIPSIKTPLKPYNRQRNTTDTKSQNKQHSSFTASMREEENETNLNSLRRSLRWTMTPDSTSKKHFSSVNLIQVSDDGATSSPGSHMPTPPSRILRNSAHQNKSSLGPPLRVPHSPPTEQASTPERSNVTKKRLLVPSIVRKPEEIDGSLIVLPSDPNSANEREEFSPVEVQRQSPELESSERKTKDLSKTYPCIHRDKIKDVVDGTLYQSKINCDFSSSSLCSSEYKGNVLHAHSKSLKKTPRMQNSEGHDNASMISNSGKDCLEESPQRHPCHKHSISIKSVLILPISEGSDSSSGASLDFGDRNVVGERRSIPFNIQPENVDSDDLFLEIEKIPLGKGINLIVSDNIPGMEHDLDPMHQLKEEKTKVASPILLTLRMHEKAKIWLTWTPLEEGDISESIIFRIPQCHGRLKINILGHATFPNLIDKRLRFLPSSIRTEASFLRKTDDEDLNSTPLTKENQRLNGDVSPTQRTWSSSKGGVKVLSSSLSEESAQKQCQCFTEWLNFMILPSNGAESESDDKKRPAFKTLVMHQRLAQARTRGLQVFNTSEMMQARNAIVAEISRGKLSLREDRDMYADLSQRSKIMSLLLSYSYQWLQIGLEILFGEAIPSRVSTTQHVLTKNKSAPTKEISTMRTVLKNVIVNKLLTDSATLHKYTKGRCNVPSGRFEIKYREDMRTVIITRLLVLIIFLDKAKRANVLDRVPCLFGKDSTVKSTRDVLRMLCRDFMSSEGDIIKHLSKIGILVSYKQDILDELDLKVNNLAVDIRDGVCFARMTEIFSSTNPKAILSKLRLPAVSRLQKLHNIGMVLEALTALGVPNLDEVASHHIVDGYREQVLELLWTIFVQLGVNSILNYRCVVMEIEKLEQTSCKTSMIWNQSVEIRSNASITESMKAESREMEIKKLMLRWCNTVLAPHGITVSDFSRCFADGIAICVLIHCYHPALLSMADIKPSLNQGIGQSQAVINDRYNIAMAGSVINDLGGIPNLLPDCDTKNPPESRSMFVFLLYLCSRLLESSAEVAACLRIQAWYRRRKNLCLIKKKIAASKCIWSSWKERKESYYSAQKKTYKLSVDIIERFFWNKRKQFQALRKEREFLQLQTTAVTIIQAYIRKYLSQLKLKFLRRISSSIQMLQKWWRARRLRRFIHELFIKKSSITCIQSMWRRKSARNRYIIVSHGLILLQALTRGHFSRRLQIVKIKAATEIQRVWRGFTAQVLFHIDKLDIITVQSVMRRNIATRRCNKKQVALRKIQAFSRMILTMRKVEQYRIHLMIESSRHQGALLFQSAFRGFTCRRFLQNIGSVEKIQKHSKGWNERVDKENMVHAIPKIQSVARQLMTSSKMQKINYSALLIQKGWRCFRQKKLIFQNVGGELVNIQGMARRKHLSPRFKFHFIHHQATVIQKTWRRAIMQTKYRDMKLIIKIQSIARKTMRKKILPLNISEAATLQRCERIRKNCIKTSSWELMRHAEYQAEKERRAIVLIQRCWRQLNVMALKHGVTFQRKNAGVHWPTFFVQLIMRYVISMYLLQKLAFERERRNTSMITHTVLVRRDYKQRIAINYTHSSGHPLFYSAKKFDNEKTAATTLQSWIRVYMSKTEMAKKLKVIRQVQSIWKMSRERIAYSCYLRSILLIQSTLRLFIATKLASRRRTSLVKIQSFARMICPRIEFMKIRMDFRSRKEEMIIMARRLQAFWRTIRLKLIHTSKRQRKSRISTSEVTLTAKNSLKYCLAKAKLQSKRDEHDRESLCLLRIQAFFRGWQTRKLIQRQSLAAIIIQREWKCFVAFLQYHSDMVDIIIVQSVIRRHQARKLKLLRSKAVYKMQSIARRYLALKRASLRFIDMLSRTEVRSYCSITIQSAYRCYKAKASFRSYRAAKTIQKAWRCFSCQMNYLLKLISILSIQRYVRAYNITKKKEKSIFLHIAVFQAICRGSKARQHYHRIRSEIIKLQCFCRGHIARRNLDREHRSAINIQRITRGFLDRTDIQICAFAAADIQRCWRGFLGRIDAAFKFLMILRLQNLARRFLASQLTVKKRQQGKREQSLQCQKALVIKRDFSNHLRRQEQNRAASVIQRFLTYCIFNKLNMAAIVIQRCFRNMKVRKLQNEQQLRATRKTALASKRAIQHPYQILGLRTQRALWIVQNSTRMREIKEAAKILEASTRLSITCCRAFVDIGAPSLLYNLMNACNRSLPHIEILTYLLLTLQNVSKHKSLVEKMASVHAAEIFLDLVQMLRDKSNIFRIALTLLYLYARTSDACKGVCSRPESLKRLNHVLNRVLEMELGRRDQPKAQKYWGRTMTNEDDAIKILRDFLMFLK